MSSYNDTSNANTSNNVVGHDYNNNVSSSYKNSYSAIPVSFNGDALQFSRWKSKMHSHIIDVDDEL